MGVTFTITKVSAMPTANVVGTLPVGSPPAGGSSVVTITETLVDGTKASPAAYTVQSPANSFSFTAGIGSSLDASQVNVSNAGFSSPPTVTPTFVIDDPSPPAPAGPIAFAVAGVNA